MSVYSGFATRNQETLYSKLTEKALTILTQKVLNTYNPSGNYYINYACRIFWWDGFF